MAAQNVPKGAEVWRVDGRHYYLVYNVPGTNPPVPLIWHVDSDEQLRRIVGDTASAQIRNVDRAHVHSSGALYQGKSAEVQNVEQAYRRIVSDYDAEAAIRPSLRNPDVLALTVAAALEGRQVTDAELFATDYWRNATQAQRDWEEFAASDPATARQRLDSNKIRVRDALIQAGYQNPTQGLVDHYAQQFTSGAISDVQLQDAIRRETDPYAAGASPFAGRYAPEGSQAITKDGRYYLRIGGQDWLMTGLGQVARYGQDATEVGEIRQAGKLEDFFAQQGDPEATALGGEERVRGLVNDWLGPMFGGRNWSDRMIAEWAGRLRQNPQSEEQLVELLRGQFQGLFPGHAGNDAARYSTVAAPWLAFMAQAWGQQADETDELTHRIINLNDATEAGRVLREEGMRRGIGKVQDDALSALRSQLGDGIRPAVRTP